MRDPMERQVLERLQRVEARQRRPYLLGACGLAFLLSAMSGGPQEAAFRRDVVEVGELRVVQDGATRIRLGVDADGAASVTILDPSGTRRIAWTATPGAPARIELFDSAGEPQPLIGQIASEAGELGRDAVREARRELEAAIGPEIARVRDALAAWQSELAETAEPGARADARPPTLEMRIVAEPGDPSIDLEDAQRRLRAWLGEHPEAGRDPGAIRRFHARLPEAGGPTSNLVRWFPHVIRPSRDDPQRWDIAMSRMDMKSVVAAFDDRDWNGGSVVDGRERLIEYVPLRMTGESFTGADIDPAQIQVGLDSIGNPALTYSMRAGRQEAFADWSEANAGRHAAIVIDGQVDSAPRFISRISGRAQITGRFTQEDVEDLARRLSGRRR